ncbi:hypothetical protein AKJ38_02740 [candidate division MSBL1 archaeon SCGC-AAA259I14]|uniref:Uncharacterized protein n=2 Tax=candidate division MSBL1 TaxID=215777 RepID=A0A133URA8_9EURY|nr:hypothetical protein AKJ61_03270 [candidate division MSBL1 archaeon SCGC-AAA259B11]KXA96713.1 hypothetical protein AKJ38_02740 [candidate division MSBL1 archaeon SCGC-AAA259I14]
MRVAGDTPNIGPLKGSKRRFAYKGTAENARTVSRSDISGHKSLLGKVRGDGVSFTYNPELLDPLKGEWDLNLGEGLPLRAEKALDGGERFWKANVTVVIPPKAENASTPLSGSSPLSS